MLRSRIAPCQRPGCGWSGTGVRCWGLGAVFVWASACAGENPPGFPAQSGPQTEIEYRQRHWDRDDGLPDNSVLSLLQTPDGFLWIGTADGLARFDGLRFEVFDRRTCPGYEGTEVRALARTADGRVWLGTPQGLWSLTLNPTPRLRLVDGLAGQAVRVLCVSPADELWIGTEAALYRVVGDDARAVPAPLNPKPREPVVHALVTGTDGTVWAATRDGLLRRAPGEAGFSRTVAPGDAPEWMKSHPERLAPDADAWLWSVRSGLVRESPEAQELIVERSRLPYEDAILTLLRSASGDVWLGYEQSGLWRWRAGHLTRFHTASGLPDTWINCLLDDRDGNLWIGTERGGLACWQPRRFAHLTTTEGLPHDNTWTLTPASRGGVWIGTESGVGWSPGGARVTALPGLTPASPRIRALHESREGTLWIGTGDSLESWTQGAQQTVRWDDPVAANKIRVITSDPSGRVWVGRESGLMCLARGRWSRYTTADGLPHNDVRALQPDGPDHLWAGTFGGGLCRLNTSGPGLTVETRLDHTHGLPGNSVWALHREPDGTLWAGTDRGLARVSGHPVSGSANAPRNVAGPPSPHERPFRIDAFTRRHGLPWDEVNEVLEDEHGHLWLSSDRGLCQIRKADLEAVTTASANAVMAVIYDDTDGMLGRETNGQKSQPAGCRTPDGRLWFPTIRGVVIIDPARTRGHHALPPPVISRVQVDQEVIRDHTPARSDQPPARSTARPRSQMESDRELRLPAGRGRVVEFEYTAADFRSADALRFRHRLAGFEEGWVDAGARRTVLYANIPPGRYRFEVQAARHGAPWSTSSEAFTFHLAPHLYQRAWFWPAGLLGAAVVGAVAASWRIRDLRRRHALEREGALSRERERIARDMHDDLGARLNHLALLSDPAVSPGTPAKVAALVQDAARSLDAIVWATQPARDSLPHLVSYLTHTAHEHARAAGIALDLDLPDDIPPHPLTAAQRHHLFLAAREAIHNAVRHARATRLGLRLRLTPAGFALEIADNGCGFHPAGADAGNGLANMRERLASIAARLDLDSRPGHGTRVTIHLSRP